MINSTLFKTKIKELEDAFDYDIPERRLKIYYAQLNENFTNEEFPRVITQLLRTRYRFPSISDFFDIKRAREEEERINPFKGA